VALRDLGRILGRAFGVACLLSGAMAPAAVSSECDALPRQLKLDALDQRWGGVLEDADKLLACDPQGPSAVQAAFYRARALDRLRRPPEALAAYDAFLKQSCGGTGEDSILCSDARVGQLSLAGEQVAKGDAAQMKVLVDGLKGRDPYGRVFAGIQISKLSGDVSGAKEAKAQALPVLVEGYRLEDDKSFRNEICMAIIRIDPSKCGGGNGGKGTGAPEPQWIKVRVFDCKQNVEKVKVNMPFSFARAVIESMGPEVMTEVKKQGFDLENLWKSLQKMGPEQVFRLEINDSGECEKIEIWFE
jgi:hypothetical protein